MKQATLILLACALSFAAVAGPKSIFNAQDTQRVLQDPTTIMAMSEQERQEALKQGAFDFDSEKAYIDVDDAMYSKEYVHRHLLSAVIADSTQLQLGRLFVNFLTTTSYVHQEGDGINVKWIEFVSGGMTISGGYATEGGHTVELGASLSAISHIFLAYRYFLGGGKWSVWPYVGAGAGFAMGMLNISDGPFEVQVYQGPKNLFSGTVGMLLPMPDVGLRLQVNIDFWGSNRAVFTPGLGVVVFL